MMKKKKEVNGEGKLELNIQPHFLDKFNLIDSTYDRNYHKWLKVKLIFHYKLSFFLIIFFVAFLVESVLFSFFSYFINSHLI